MSEATTEAPRAAAAPGDSARLAALLDPLATTAATGDRAALERLLWAVDELALARPAMRALVMNTYTDDVPDFDPESENDSTIYPRFVVPIDLAWGVTAMAIRTRPVAPAALLLALVLVAGCSGGDDDAGRDDPAGTTAPPAPPAKPATAATPAAPTSTATMQATGRRPSSTSTAATPCPTWSAGCPRRSASWTPSSAAPTPTRSPSAPPQAKWGATSVMNRS